jgi:hypothetical protein
MPLGACASRNEPPRTEPATSTPPGDTSTPTSDAGVLEQLTAEQISPVIGAAVPRVKRACWQPALNTRYEGDPTLLRVVAQIDIGADGSVSHARAQQGPYPKLSSCIEGVLRTLKFPESASGAKVNVPFVFGAR